MVKIREAIVVEGRYDKNTLSQIVDAPILETSGFGIMKDKAQLSLLRKIANTRGLIVFTDSDGAGFVIRNHIKSTIDGKYLKHAYIPDIPGKERRKAAPGKEGKLGEVFHVYLSFRSHRSIPGLGGAFTTKEIAGGGVLVDWGVHFLDLVMYCMGDPKPLTVSGETFCKLGKAIPAYTFKDMWAGPPVLDGIYDVEESVTAVVRTEGPTFTVHGAWAQNIGENEMFVDFMGDKGGIRLQYGKDFTLYSTKNDMLTTTTFVNRSTAMFQNEIDSFINCIETGKKLPSNIDSNILTSQMMDAIYRSAEEHREVIL